MTQIETHCVPSTEDFGEKKVITAFRWLLSGHRHAVHHVEGSKIL
jgi:hypothetical protein